MRLKLLVPGLLAIGLASCQTTTSTENSTNSDTTTMTTTDPAMNADPNMITTTTTTTTTRPAFQPRENVQYMDLRTKKMVRVRVDTVHHYVVNAETNQPLDFFMEPGGTDTFYGRNMQRANGYIRYNSGNDWSYDESMGGGSSNMNSGSSSMDMSTTGTSSTGTGSDVKKIKTNENETKIKMEDGSKIKTNENGTKIKNK